MKINKKEKGKFLQEFYDVEDIPSLINEDGSPTKFAEAAKYWGENIPSNKEEVLALVKLGISLCKEDSLEEVKLESEVKEELKPTFEKLSNSWYSGTQELSLLDSNLIKVPFVKQGSWKHDVYGEVKFTEEDVKQLISNYKNNVTGFTPYLTLGHLDEEINSTDSHRKRGDLKDIVQEGSTTYGIFKVNDDMYKRVENGEYEYASGEFHRQFKNKETGDLVGTTVLRVALTNSPFLPFGNEKIQALSSDNCPEYKENFVFLLSLDKSNKEEIKAPVTTEDSITSFAASEEINTEVPTTIIENITLQNNTSIMSTENIKTEVNETELQNTSTVALEVEVAKSEVIEPLTIVKEEIKSNQGDEILNNLTSQLEKVQELYSKQLDAANKTIETLVAKVDTLTEKLMGQEKVTQAFSSSMNEAQERGMIQNLQNNGVLPANIQRFVALKKAFQTADNKNVVRLSVNSGDEIKEVDTNLMDAISDLLIASSNQSPVIEQQLGISAGRKTGAFDFNNIIKRNQTAAEKLNAQ